MEDKKWWNTLLEPIYVVEDTFNWAEIQSNSMQNIQQSTFYLLVILLCDN